MASVERTAYPRFKRIISERELAQFFTPDEAEIAWAAKRTHDRPESRLTLLVLLKSCARLGYFPGLGEVPALVIACVRAAAGLPGDVIPVAEERTAKRYRSWVREYLGLAYDPAARSAPGSPGGWAQFGPGWRGCWWCRMVSAAVRST